MRKLFTFFLVLAASIGTMFAEKVKIGDLYYNLDEGNKTAEVARSSYSGDIVIPASVEYNSVTYSVTSIGAGAFNNCSGLTSVTIPNSVTSIGDGTFLGCTGLTSIDVATDNLNYSSSGGVLFNKGKTTLVAYPGGKQGAYTIPNSVTSIGDYAFYGCTGLTSVTIPNSVTSIGMYAFSDCSGLTSIDVATDNPNYSSSGGVLFNKGKTTLVAYPGGKQGAYTIPNSVTSIGDYAFYGCTGLTLVTIGNSVTSIGVTAFAECSGLTSVTIPNSVTYIGDVAFAGCTGLTSLTCMATTPPVLGADAFRGTVTTSTLLYVPVGSISAYKYSEWDWFKNILPIGAEETETNTVKTESTTNSVEVTWPQVAGAYTYEIVIKDKSGKVVCTLVFNAQGQLQSIAFNAPSRDGAPQHKQEAGFSFVVNSLDSGTEYGFDVIAKDENGNVLDTKSGSFTTQAPQGIDDINAATKSQKIVRDNQVLILRGDKTYTTDGRVVR